MTENARAAACIVHLLSNPFSRQKWTSIEDTGRRHILFIYAIRVLSKLQAV